jgi:aminopeptidase N
MTQEQKFETRPRQMTFDWRKTGRTKAVVVTKEEREFHIPTSIEGLDDAHPVKAKNTRHYRVPKGKVIDGFELDIDDGKLNIQAIDALYLNRRKLERGKGFEYYLDEGGKPYLLIKGKFKKPFTITSEVSLFPHNNTDKEGLYISTDPRTGKKLLTTQDEEKGYCRIFPSVDEPYVRVMKTKTKITYPADLPYDAISNGNPGKVRTADGRKAIEWTLNRPGPSYLFALMAGEFGKITDEFETRSKNKVAITTYVSPGDEDRALVGTASLKKAMKFDEDTYGFEFPYKSMKMGVVRDFNAGAMENTSLIIFRDHRFLVDPKLSVDGKIRDVALVVAHEYFHTFSGNEVTVKSFKQPALKEGLTTYRESQFMVKNFGVSERVRRIKLLRSNQFHEDNSSLAHAIYPDNSWNPMLLYDDTTYRKGAFLYGVLHTLLDDKGFYAGMKLYRERFTGRAANFDDFLKAMSDANRRIDLSSFKKWWMQPGTPQVTANWSYDEDTGTWTLTIAQKNDRGDPVLMPLPVQFIGADGNKLNAQLLDEKGKPGKAQDDHTLWVKQAEQKFTFTGFEKGGLPPVAAFGSHVLPVQFDPQSYQGDDLIRLMTASALDPMLRYEAAQNAMRQMLLAAYKPGATLDAEAVHKLADAYRRILAEQGTNLDPEMKAYMLEPPSLDELSLAIGKNVDFARLNGIRGELKKELGEDLNNELMQAFTANKSVPKKPEQDLRAWNEEARKRSLRVACLSLLDATGNQSARDLVASIAADRDSDITERQAAVTLAASWDNQKGDELVDRVGEEWNASDFSIIKDELMKVRMTAHHHEAFQRAKEETAKVFAKGEFSANDVEATAIAFMGNLPAFHSNVEETYRFAADVLCQVAPKNDRLAIKVVKAWTRDIGRMTDAQRELTRGLLETQVMDTLNATSTTSGTRQAVERSIDYIKTLHA